MMKFKQHNHWLYAIIPLFGAGVWFGMLWAMLIVWLADGQPRYPSQDGSITYISDVGAFGLKPLFIAGCSVTAACFFLSLTIERWLRHRGRLLPNMRRRERVFSSLAILGAFIGGLGLILLSIFDTQRHTSAHRAFLLVFIVGVGLSAIFTIVEFRWISHEFGEIRKLKAAYIAKGVIAGTLILLAILFAILLYTVNNAGAVVEWVIAFGFTFYMLTFVYDLRMAKGVRAGQLKRKRLLDMRQRGQTYDAALREAHIASGGGSQSHLSHDVESGSVHLPSAAGDNGYAEMTNGYHAPVTMPEPGLTFPEPVHSQVPPNYPGVRP